MVRPSPAGAGIQVSPDRLLPRWYTTGLFGFGLVLFALIPLFLWLFQEPLAAGSVRHRDVVFLNHVYVLGWAMAVVVGALPQLSVVAFKSSAPKSRTALAAVFGAFIVGVLALLTGFRSLSPLTTAAGGTLLTAAFIAVVALSVRTLSRGERPSVMLAFAAPAMLSLIAVGCIGVALAIHLATGWLGSGWRATFLSHLFLGPIGFFGLLVPGVSYELGPFFGLTRTGSDKGRGRLPFAVAGLLLLGLAGAVTGSALGRFHPFWLLPLGAGYILFVIDLRGMYGHRAPVRRTAILTGVRAGQGYLLALGIVLGLAGVGMPAMSHDRLVLAVGWIAAAGWLSNTVAAYLHRILPFLMWHHKYWGKPKEQVKTPFQGMVDQLLGRRGFYVYNGGVVLFVAGLWLPALITPAIALVALGTLMLVFNLGRAYLR